MKNNRTWGKRKVHIEKEKVYTEIHTEMRRIWRYLSYIKVPATAIPLGTFMLFLIIIAHSQLLLGVNFLLLKK